MKRLTILTALVALALGAAAQTMKLHTKATNTTYLLSPQQVEQAAIDGTDFVLNVGGATARYAFSDIDSISFTEETLREDSLIVTWADGAVPHLEIPVAMAGVLTVSRDAQGNVEITDPRTEGEEYVYVLQGKSSTGSFTQNGSYKFTMMLNGLSLTSAKGAAINITNGKRVDIRVADGTTNTFADCTDGMQKACFFVNGHAEFKGGGTVNITGNSRHGYRSDEYTILKQSFSGRINILKAVSDGMHVCQYFQMNNGQVKIANVGNDGLQVAYSNDPEDEMNGQLLLNAGTIDINVSGHQTSGIKSDSIMTVTGGTYTVTSTGLAGKAVNVHSAVIDQSTGATQFTLSATGGTITVEGDVKKGAGFKTDHDLTFKAGTITIGTLGNKAKGIKVGGDYYYSAAAKTNTTPDVTGETYLVK